MEKVKRIIRSKKGQGLIELGLALPILLLLSLGAIEIANMIDARLVLSHLTREGANMISLGPPPTPDEALEAIIDASCPLISNGPTGPPTFCPPENTDRWRIIYSRIGPNPAATDTYVIREQVVMGSGSVVAEKRVCPECGLLDFPSCGASCITPSNVPNLDEITSGGTFNVIEVFYEYQPTTPVSNFGVGLGNLTFYERSIF